MWKCAVTVLYMDWCVENNSTVQCYSTVWSESLVHRAHDCRPAQSSVRTLKPVRGVCVATLSLSCEQALTVIQSGISRTVVHRSYVTSDKPIFAER